MVKKLLIFLVFVLVVAQFIRPEKNISHRPQPDDLFAQQPAPEQIRVAVEHACYDCHSNNTRYPWYAQVQPLGWWLAKHVKDGKDHLNFSEFGSYPAKRAVRKLEQFSEQIEDGSMPLKSYTLIHRDARFTPEQIKQLLEWLDALQERLKPTTAQGLRED